MKVTILGAGDISKIHRYSKLSELEVKTLIEDLGKFLAQKKVDLVIVPARGIPYEVAKVYKANNGPKVIGVIPREDKEYGIMHIQEYMHISDEEINIGNWYDLNGKIASLSDYAICIGISGGAICDISMLKYHYKYKGSKTKLIIFKNTLSKKLPKEIEEDLGDNLKYINKVSQLKRILK